MRKPKVIERDREIARSITCACMQWECPDSETIAAYREELTGELVELLHRAESKLRQMAAEFNSPMFPDRYGDGPLMQELAEDIHVAIAKAEGREG